MSGIVRAARTPHCLLAVDALHGGRWLSPLREGGVQPSAVERNFWVESGNFIAGKGVPADDMINDDWEFIFDATPSDIKPGQSRSFFYPPMMAYGAAIFSAYLDASGRLTVATGLAGSTENALYVLFEIPSALWKTSTRFCFEVTVVGNTVTLYVDKIQVEQVIGNVRHSPPYFSDGTCGSNIGYLHNVKITNLTKSRVIFSYPSWPEKTRLLTYNNVTTASGAFEAADKTKTRWVATQLDFRNRATDFTMLVKCRVPRHAPNGKAYVSSLLSQGNVYWGDRDRCVCGIWVTEDYRGTTPVFNVSGSPTVRFDVSADFLGRDHVIALTVTTADNRSRLYLDGALAGISDALRPALPLSAAPLWPGDNSVLKIGAQTDSLYYSEPVIYSALVYDYALPASQIAAISKQI